MIQYRLSKTYVEKKEYERIYIKNRIKLKKDKK